MTHKETQVEPKTGKPSGITDTSWPKRKVASVETRKRDLVIRIADWTLNRDEPAYDVEVYHRGVYDWNESQTFSTREIGRTRGREKAAEFAKSIVDKYMGGAK